MKKILISLGSTLALGLPMLALADGPKLDSYLGDLMKQASTLLSQLLVFLIGLAVVWFIWNVVKYSMSNEDEGKEKAKSQMIHGIIALAVIVSIWGIVAILRSAFGTENGTIPNVNNMIPGATTNSSSYSPTAAGSQSSFTGTLNPTYPPIPPSGQTDLNGNPLP